MGLAAESIATDLHCVTRWSKLGYGWRGVSLDTLLSNVETEADFALALSYGGYTTNLPLEDLLDGKAWIAYEYNGEDLAPEHGGPARLLVPHLYLWKSAKWIRGIDLMLQDSSPASGDLRLPRLWRPMARAAVSGGLRVRRAWRPAVLVERRTETPSASTLVFEVAWMARSSGWATP